jgi:hypothetical protein
MRVYPKVDFAGGSGDEKTGIADHFMQWRFHTSIGTRTMAIFQAPGRDPKRFLNAKVVAVGMKGEIGAEAPVEKTIAAG